MLATAPNDDRLPVSLASLVLFGGAPPATRDHVFFTHCVEPLTRMKSGLERADAEVRNLPLDIVAEIRIGFVIAHYRILDPVLVHPRDEVDYRSILHFGVRRRH